MVRISVDLPDEVAEALKQLAVSQSSTPAQELARMAARSLAARVELQRLLAEGLADLEAGRAIPNDEVMADLDAWVEEVEAKQRGGS